MFVVVVVNMREVLVARSRAQYTDFHSPHHTARDEAQETVMLAWSGREDGAHVNDHPCFELQGACCSTGLAGQMWGRERLTSFSPSFHKTFAMSTVYQLHQPHRALHGYRHGPYFAPVCSDYNDSF